VPTLTRPDGVEIHWEERGRGPLVVLAAYWSGHPGVHENLAADLARDHRVVTYDARGTGGSSRTGPYDIETDTGDLEALVEEAGEPAAVLSIANGANVATRLGARREDLVSTVVSIGTAPIWAGALEGAEGMLGSDTVRDAFIEMVGRDYRGAMRSFLAATNPQMSEEELRERVAFQVGYCPREAAVGRLRAWEEDNPTDDASALGERLVVLRGRDVAGPWLPPEADLDELASSLMPEARVVEVAEGPVSRPDLAAAAVRRIVGGQPLD
jgi:pimeloyl-ACP methyl ester carboxylesterase